jgi:GNAT superfamily N-acetyltransferase
MPLGPTHNVGSFACGDKDVDGFLHHLAMTEQALKLSQIYVSSSSDRNVLAYFTLSPVMVRVDSSLLQCLGVGTLPYPSIGGFLLGRLGVHCSLQRRGIGEALVMRAAQIAKREAKLVGGAFLAVDPKTDELVRWYSKQDFFSLGGKTRRMVLPFRLVP